VTAADRSRSVRTHNKEVRIGWKNLGPLLGPQFVCNCVLVLAKYLQAFAHQHFGRFLLAHWYFSVDVFLYLGVPFSGHPAGPVLNTVESSQPLLSH
jgi:hypothetical protein